MTYYLMYWKCHYCDTTDIFGYIYDCPGCGKPRSKGVVFYDPPTLIEATPEQVKLMGGDDPNWYCEHCDSGNRQENDTCWKCSAPRGSSPDDVQYTFEAGAEKVTEEGAKAREDNTEHLQRQRRPEKVDDYNPPVTSSRPESSSVTSYPRQKRDIPSEKPESTGINPKKILIGVGAALTLALVIWAIWFFGFNTHKVEAMVTGFSWSQSVSIQEYQTLHKQGWSVPVGGRETDHQLRKNGQDKIHDGWDTVPYPSTCDKTTYEQKTCYKDNKNGSKSPYECGKNVTTQVSCTKTKQVERFHMVDHIQNWYWYDIDEWVEIINRPTSGSDHRPVFDNVQPNGSKQRRIESLGIYSVYFENAETGKFNKNYDLSQWKLFNIEQNYPIEVNPVHAIIKYPDPVLP